MRLIVVNERSLVVGPTLLRAGMPVDRILAEMGGRGAGAVNLMILDAAATTPSRGSRAWATRAWRGPRPRRAP